MYATNVQNGHSLFLDQFQIDNNMHPLRFTTFPLTARIFRGQFLRIKAFT
jgi:hypothetical protein